MRELPGSERDLLIFTADLSSAAVLRSVAAVPGLNQETSRSSAAAEPSPGSEGSTSARRTLRLVFDLHEKFSENRVDAPACGDARQREPRTRAELSELTRSNLRASTSVPLSHRPPVLLCVSLSDCVRLFRTNVAHAQQGGFCHVTQRAGLSAGGSGGTRPESTQGPKCPLHTRVVFEMSLFVTSGPELVQVWTAVGHGGGLSPPAGATAEQQV